VRPALTLRHVGPATLPSELSTAILLSTSATLPFFDAPRRSVGTMPEQVFIAVMTGKVPEVVGPLTLCGLVAVRVNAPSHRRRSWH